jgi:CO dehydrogenase/acetyl-CoA synthase beta subunit
VAKTLSNASVNPFMASAAAGYNPVLALDVFLVQVCLGCGCFSAVCLWLTVICCVQCIASSEPIDG